jgi:hypothetical protein
MEPLLGVPVAGIVGPAGARTAQGR